MKLLFDYSRKNVASACKYAYINRKNHIKQIYMKYIDISYSCRLTVNSYMNTDIHRNILIVFNSLWSTIMVHDVFVTFK